MKRCGLKILKCGTSRHPEYLARRNASFKTVTSPIYAGLIEHPEEGLILFDTGYDDAFFKATQTFPERFYRWTLPVEFSPGDSASEQLQNMGYSKNDVRAVILSHFHGDHIAGLHNFPSAKIFCSRAGHKDIYKKGRFTQVRHGILASLLPSGFKHRTYYFEDCKINTLPKSFFPFEVAADLFGDGSLLAIDLPGHCPGHWGLALCMKNGRHTFLTADSAWSITAIQENISPPDITLKLIGSSARYGETLNKLHTLYTSNSDILMLPSHCEKAVQSFKKENV